MNRIRKLPDGIRKKIAASIRREHVINTQEKTIMLIGIDMLDKVDPITQERIRLFMKHEKYKVYSQQSIW